MRCVLSACITAMGLSLYFNLEHFRLPDWRDGARRIERDSTLVHRPISEGEDVLSAGEGDAWAQALWNAHLSRRLADFGRLHLAIPRSDLPRHDPRALRFVVLLLIVAGAFFANNDWRNRWLAAFGPGTSEAASVSIDAWIDPPGYTGEPPVYLSGQSHHHGAGRFDGQSPRPWRKPHAVALSRQCVVHGRAGRICGDRATDRRRHRARAHQRTHGWRLARTCSARRQAADRVLRQGRTHRT